MANSYVECAKCEKVFYIHDSKNIKCDCGKIWCTKKCAEEDGYYCEEDDDGHFALDHCNHCLWKQSEKVAKYCEGVGNE
jgi:hypothetical protein